MMDSNQQASGKIAGSDDGEEPSRKVPVFRTENNLINDEFDSLRGRFDEEMRQMEEELARFRSQMTSSIHNQRGAKQTISKNRSQHSTLTSEMTSSSSTSSRISQHASELALRQPDGVASPVEPAAAAEQACGVAAPVHRQHAQAVASSQMDSLSQGAASADSRACDRGAFEPSIATNWIENFVNSPLIVDNAKGGGGKLLKLRFDVSAYEPDKIVVRTLDNRLQVHAERERKSENRIVSSEYNREFLLPVGVDPETITSTLSADGILTIEAPLLQKP